MPAYEIPFPRGLCRTCGERNACFTGRRSRTQVCGACMDGEIRSVEHDIWSERQASHERQTRRVKAAQA